MCLILIPQPLHGGNLPTAAFWRQITDGRRAAAIAALVPQVFSPYEIKCRTFQSKSH
jgi:hypothetical protein